MRTLVVLPTYNEAENVLVVAEGLFAAAPSLPATKTFDGGRTVLATWILC